jgi:hypothetical protein
MTQHKQVRRRRKLYKYIPYSASSFAGIYVIGDKIKSVFPEYLAGKRYVASDWLKNSEKKYFLSLGFFFNFFQSF